MDHSIHNDRDVAGLAQILWMADMGSEIAARYCVLSDHLMECVYDLERIREKMGEQGSPVLMADMGLAEVMEAKRAIKDRALSQCMDIHAAHMPPCDGVEAALVDRYGQDMARMYLECHDREYLAMLLAAEPEEIEEEEIEEVCGL